MHRPGELVVGLGFLAIGIGFAVGAVKLQIGAPTEPQPGFFPFWDGLILITLSLLFIVQVFRGRTGEGQKFGNLARPAIVVVALILYLATLEKVGYVITTAILSAAVLKVLDTRPLILVLVSVILAISSYLLFDRLLGVTLPAGILAAVF